MTTFERNDRAVLPVLDRVDEVLLREEDGRVHHRQYALGDRDAEDLGRQARQREQAALRQTMPGAGTSSTFLAAAATVALARSVVREIMLVTEPVCVAESRASQRN